MQKKYVEFYDKFSQKFSLYFETEEEMKKFYNDIYEQNKDTKVGNLFKLYHESLNLYLGANILDGKYYDLNKEIDRLYNRYNMNKFESFYSFVNGITQFLNHLYISNSFDIFIYLFNNNHQVINSFKNCIVPKDGKYDISFLENYNNEEFLEIIEMYCDLNKIEVIEEDHTEDMISSMSEEGKALYDSSKMFPLLSYDSIVNIYKILNSYSKDSKEYKKAYEKIIMSNQRLIFKIAYNLYKTSSPALDLDDLIQEGNLGLMKAVNKYDYTKGYMFSTYAIWWIRQAIQRAIYDKSSIIRIPVHLKTQVARIRRFISSYENKHGHLPSYDTIGEALNIESSIVSRVLQIEEDIISLNIKISNDEGEGEEEIGDFIQSDLTTEDEAD